jgi:hypothetical protein
MISSNVFPTNLINQQLQKIKQASPKELKAQFPLYPTIKKQEIGDGFSFITLVRKFYQGRYYLYVKQSFHISESRAIHELHKEVHTFLMIGVCHFTDKEDDNQISEFKRLEELSNPKK